MNKTPGFNPNRIFSNRSKKLIAESILERYTGSKAHQFHKRILLTNFDYYIQQFAQLTNGTITQGTAMRACHSDSHKVTIVNFNIGSPTAALIIEVLAAIEPEATLLLGMCGGLHRSLKVGDFIIPTAAIRGEGVTGHFMPPEVPALPTFKIQKFVSQKVVEAGLDYRTGVVHTTDYRFWEFSDAFKEKLYTQRVIGIEMETAALFITGFVSKVPIGALLLVSDLPLRRGGIKKSAKRLFTKYTDLQLNLGIKAMAEISKGGDPIRHYKW